MRNNVQARGLLFALTLTVGLLFSGAAVGWPGGGSGGGGGKPPNDAPPPPALFGLQLFAMPGDYAGGTVAPQKMNDVGEVVGYYLVPDGRIYQPFYIDAFSGASVATNLNDLSLDPGYEVPDGWYIYAAFGINNQSDIIGALALISDPDQLRGFVLELAPDPADPSLLPRLHLIPDEAWTHTYPRRINDVGEILGFGDSATAYSYHPALHGLPGDADVWVLPFPFDAWGAQMNNPTASHDTQVVGFSDGVLVGYTPGDATAVPLGLDVSDVRGLSDNSSFCGYQIIQVRKNKSQWIGYSYDGALHDLPEVKYAQDVNVGGDVVGDRLGQAPLLYHADHGILDLNELVVAQDSFEQQLWADGAAREASMTERGVPGADPAVIDFPAIAGRLQRFDTEWSAHFEVYVLLPIPPL